MKKSAKKGQFGYFSSEKLRRLLITLGLFAGPVLVLIISSLYYGSRMNIWTVIAAVGSLPACKSCVSLVMILMRHPMDKALYEEIRSHQGDLDMVYEMYMTFYEKSAYLDAVAVCGNTVAGYSSDPKIDAQFMAENAQKLIRKNGYKVDVKILTEKRQFMERLDSMNAHKASLEEGIRFQPDSRYPSLTRNELILHTLLALCL